MADRDMFLNLMSAAAQVVNAGRKNTSDAPRIPMDEGKVYELFLDRWWGTVSVFFSAFHLARDVDWLFASSMQCQNQDTENLWPWVLRL